MVTALFQVGGTLATSIGSAVAGAIFTNLLPGEFAAHIPGKPPPHKKKKYKND